MNQQSTPDWTSGTPQNKRQTLSYLAQLLASQGLRAKKIFGQNFLVDLNLLDLLVKRAKIGKGDVVLEVGAGTGSLTSRLVQEAGYVVSVEIDDGFYKLASTEVEGAKNITLLHTDILKGKNQMQPAVMDAVRAAMTTMNTDHFHIVANFPYDVASSIIANTLLEDIEVRSLTFTVQYEAALRIVAPPRDRDYGPLAVLVQTLGTAEIFRTLPPSAFWPQPKVDSAFVRIDITPGKKQSIHNLKSFHHFVRMLFIHRRKNLRGGIVGIVEYKPIKKQIPDILSEVGLDRDDRAEGLAPAKLFELYENLEKHRLSAGEGESD